MILSMMGTISSVQIIDSESPFCVSCFPMRLKSICSTITLSLNGFNPIPVMLIHPHNFNLLSASCAFIHCKTALISSSVSLFASSLSISSKSNISHCDADTMAVVIGDWCIKLFFLEDDFDVKATANMPSIPRWPG